jgi:hypothetical protein
MRRNYEAQHGKKRLRAKATPADPGSGPAGETCKTCKHRRVDITRAEKRFHKCSLVRSTKGPGTDIRVSTPACARWERRDD